MPRERRQIRNNAFKLHPILSILNENQYLIYTFILYTTATLTIKLSSSLNSGNIRLLSPSAFSFVTAIFVVARWLSNSAELVHKTELSFRK